MYFHNKLLLYCIIVLYCKTRLIFPRINGPIVSLILHLNAFLMPISTNKLWIRLFVSLTADKGNGTGV